MPNFISNNSSRWNSSSGNISFEEKFYRNQDACKQCILKNIQRCEKIRKYANNELVKVSVTYSQHVNIINNKNVWAFYKTIQGFTYCFGFCWPFLYFVILGAKDS